MLPDQEFSGGLDSPHTLIDACDGDGFVGGSNKGLDPSTFFLDAEDDEPVGQGSRGLLDDMEDVQNALSWDLFPTIPEHRVLHSESESELGLMGLGGSFGSVDDEFLTGYASQRGLEKTGFPRVASMPNVSVDRKIEGGGAQSIGRVRSFSKLGSSPPSLPPRSFSTNDLSSLSTPTYDVPHSQFLTAPHLRKGKGGRQPALDPRMDPKIDPKKAKRILANRLSAAKSKMKQKSAIEAARQKIISLEAKRDALAQEVAILRDHCLREELKRKNVMKGKRHSTDALEGGGSEVRKENRDMSKEDSLLGKNHHPLGVMV